MWLLVWITSFFVLVSMAADRRKTISGIKQGMGLFFNLLPTLLSVIILVSIGLFLTPSSVLVRHFGPRAGGWGYISAALIGSVALIPGFIAFPLAGMLVRNGVSYSVISVFITTLLMVGFITLPVESRFLGFKTALLRNFLSLLGALLIGLSMAMILRWM